MSRSSAPRRSRKDRARQRLTRVWLAAGLALAALIGSGIALLVPREFEKPLITLYARRDCAECARYASYLREHGFRVQRGASDSMADIYSRYRIPGALRAPQVAIVENLFVEGHVPARDIHQLLHSPYRRGARGLIVVPSLPKGSPGNPGLVPAPFTIYIVRPGGLMQQFSSYHAGWY